MAGKLVREDVGAWVLKANPDVYDVEGALAEGRVPFDSWRLSPSYRVDLIAVDDPVVLWISGSRRGIRCIGRVAGRPYVDQGGTRHWADLAEKSKIRPYLPVALVPIPLVEEATLLADDRFVEAEVIKARQMGNPSYLSPGQFGVVKGLVAEEAWRDAGWIGA